MSTAERERGGPGPDEARLAWFSAPDGAERERCLERLRHLATASRWEERAVAIRHLIELMHLSGSVGERIRIARALGTVDHVNPVPALHAELHHLDAAVRLAALEAIGQLGFPFGGAMVARWLAERSEDDEPPEVTAQALLTLARTGHPAVELEAERLWRAGQVDAASLHLALADSASSALLDLARAHVGAPDAGLAAALHLASARVDDLPDALRPLLRSADLTCVHFAERLIAAPRTAPADDVLELVDRRWRTGALGRAARRLRVHPPEALMRAFEDLRGMYPAGHARRSFVRALLMIGCAPLQAAVLGWARDEEDWPTLAHALQNVSREDASLRRLVDGLLDHREDAVAMAALRARVNAVGDLSPDALAAVARSSRPALQQEAVRGLLVLYRDRRGPDRRTTLTGAPRAAAEAMIRRALQSPELAVRRLATYAVGNLGLTGLADDARRMLSLEQPEAVRAAAATSLAELPPSTPAERLAGWAADEPSVDVRFRLGLALLEALEALDPGGIRAHPLVALARGGLADREDLRVLGLRVLGFARDARPLPELCAEAEHEHLARALAALTGLRTLGDPACRPLLERLLDAPDALRRQAAVEALEPIPGPEAGDLLVRAARDDADLEVRRAALRVLARRPASPASMRRLVPSGPSDPLLFELLQARAAGDGGGIRDVADVDVRLERAMPGFRADRLDRRCPDALRAIRTAEFLGAAPELPEGLDAAPPAIFWVKGLELWFDVATRQLRTSLREPGPRAGLEAARNRWTGLERACAGWPRTQAAPGWARLLPGLLDGLDKRADAVLSLRDIAACLLVRGPLAAALGQPRWKPEVDEAALGELAHELVTLANLRNELTHRTAGRPEQAAECRARAVKAGAALSALGG